MSSQLAARSLRSRLMTSVRRASMAMIDSVRRRSPTSPPAPATASTWTARSSLSGSVMTATYVALLASVNIRCLGRRHGRVWSAAAGGQGDEVLAAAGVDARGYRQPGHQPGEPVDQPVRRLLGVLLARAAGDQFAAALALQALGDGDQRRGLHHVQTVRPGDDHLDGALAGVAGAVRESLGDLGLLVGGATVDAGTTRVVHRHG